MNQDRTKQLEQFLTDAMAYLRFCAEHNINAQQQLITLAHDMGGLSRNEHCFSPRVSGYFKREMKHDAMTN